MTTYYVGKGGNDGNDGLNWANRFLTIAWVETQEIAAGDTVYIGPGIYRERMRMDVTGTPGNIITFIGDISGKYTDGVGGRVSICGSDDDLTSNRSWAIYVNNSDISYRTFRGFHLYFYTGATINLDRTVGDCSNLIFEDMVIDNFDGASVGIDGNANFTDIVFRRCFFFGNFRVVGITDFEFNLLVENCYIDDRHLKWYPLLDARDGYGYTFNNCTFASVMETAATKTELIRVVSIDSGHNFYVKNSVFGNGRISSLPNTLVLDYNNYQFARDTTNLINVSAGANDNFYPLLPMPPIIVDGFLLPFENERFAPYSQVPSLACDAGADEDIFGIRRPTSDVKKTRGCFQHSHVERETTTTYGSSPESLKMADAMATQIIVPITGKAMTIQARVNREANYAGIAPQITIKQAGEVDKVITDSGGVSAWNLLKTSIKPASLPKYIVIELRSDNTAISGNYATFWDALQVR
jgi:hypothetical protein